MIPSPGVTLWATLWVHTLSTPLALCNVVEFCRGLKNPSKINGLRAKNAEVFVFPPSSTTYPKTNRSRLVFFRPFPPVLARVRALLRRTLPPRTASCRAVFRSQFPPILCFCGGGLRTRSSNGAGFRLLVRDGNRLHAGDPTQSDVGRPATCSSRTSR